MSNEAAGSAAANSSVNPGDESNAPELQKKLSETQAKLDEVSGEYKKVTDFFNANKPLVEFARKYTEDPKMARLVEGVLSGAIDPDKASATSATKKISEELSNLDPDQRDIIEKAVSARLDATLGPIKSELTQLRGYQATTQLNDLRSNFTVEKGYPINFKDVESEISNLLTSGQAIDAKGAFLQIVGQKTPAYRAENDKKMRELKAQSSMSKTITPSSMPFDRKPQAKKSTVELLQWAAETLGQNGKG